jgi:hypothetical protein
MRLSTSGLATGVYWLLLTDEGHPLARQKVILLR